MEFFALSMLMLLPAGGIIAAIIVFYIIYNQFKDRNKEDFEKRDN